MKKFVKRMAALGMTAVMSVGLLTGCGGSKAVDTKNAAVILGDSAITMDEALLYTFVMKNQYEYYYGPEIWSMEKEEGVTYGQYLKDIIEDELVRVLVLNSKAKDYKVSLTSEDETSIDEYLESFKSNIGEDVMEEEGITEDSVRSVVEKSTLAGYVYQAMMDEEEVTVSDEEKANATCIKVQHILISTTDTTKTDDEGNSVEMTEDEIEAYKAQQKELAETVLKKAKDGEDFKALSDEYTAPNAGFEFSFNKDGYDPVNGSSMVEPFYTASWELGEGEISGLVESDYGYHIIKCISLNDTEATEAGIKAVEDSYKYESLTGKIQTLLDEAEYTVSDAWKAYVIESEVVESETESASTEETVETAETTETK